MTSIVNMHKWTWALLCILGSISFTAGASDGAHRPSGTSIAIVARGSNERSQTPFTPPPPPLPLSQASNGENELLEESHRGEAYVDSPFWVPRLNYSHLELDHDDRSTPVPAPEGMVLHSLHYSGRTDERVNLMFFADGYTPEEEGKFVSDAQRLKEDIVSPLGAMGHVGHLLNVWGVYVPSQHSGIGTHDRPLPHAAFGLYRPASELRAVFLQHPKRARAACRSFNAQPRRKEVADQLNGGKESHDAACDQAIILGNDPLYGGLGGEFTIITASELNGPLVLRHELGHSLIPVGEEYEGGYAYFGANADKAKKLDRLKWRDLLSDPEGVRVEDAKVPLQVYPWHDLDLAAYNITFTAFNAKTDLTSTTTTDSSSSSSSLVVAGTETKYPTALLRASLSSIPHASHITITLNDQPLDLSEAFPSTWNGSLDRRWLELPLPHGLQLGDNLIDVRLTEEGRRAQAGQGGKMITSLEIIEYGPQDRFNRTPGFVGAFPTYAMDGSMTLRPTNEECLMRKVNHPTFCPVCAGALEKSLRKRISAKKTVQAK